MRCVKFVMALSPIVVVLVGILGFRQSAKRVAPVALLWTLLLAFTYFNVTGASFKDNVAVYDALLWKGIKEGLKIVLMVFGAFVILNLLRDTGAIDEVKGAIARISDDRRVQVVNIGMMLPIFLEGAAGTGAGHEPHHRVRRTKRRRFAGQPHLPQQYGSRLRHGGSGGQREQGHEADAARLRRHPCDLHGADHAVYLRAVPQFWGLTQLNQNYIKLKG